MTSLACAPSRPRWGQLAIAGLATGLLFGGPATAWAATEMTLDLVRHGESEANVAHLLSTWPPGPGLTPLGEQQAQEVGDALYNQYGPDYYDGIYASLLTRTQETAAPLAALLGMTPQVLPGLNEIAAPAIAENLPEVSPAGVFTFLPPILWSLGLYLMPSAGSIDFNGVVFDEIVDQAVAQMYAAGDVNGDGEIHQVAFSSMGTMLVWSLMNVKNPDFGIILSHLVPNTAVIEIEGSPDDGWTLVSWDGEPVGPASLLTSLFVDTREVITAPQVAVWDLARALSSGDPAEMVTALQEGVSNVLTTWLNYPITVIQDIIGALGGGDVTPAAAIDVPDELGTAIGDALAAI